ncbi:hypothetical protein TIFTF001_003479 [Ficus carica]|uniref:SnoaL-like domain-containing protein n=1 Tax=Ficus carica TaxID=3494 RepID=A0AA87Z996_FICCA|nr:hypothetical protein TIFTF001_003479 [Ficus carica]
MMATTVGLSAIRQQTMATTVGLSGTAQWKRLRQKPRAKPSITTLATKTSSHFGQNRLETQQNAIPRERNIEKKAHRFYPVLALKRDCVSGSNPISPSETIKEFYACINDRKVKRLGNYISSDCYIEECSFSTPFEGKEDILSYFDRLTASMGHSVKFSVNQVFEGDELIAAANWHLEWKEAELPFTRGCSFFECSKEGEKLVIKRARIVNESPVKPGGLVLVLFKIVTTVFDDFPKTAECKLKLP